ncbi:MAG: TPM domain-containing protein [Eubacteriales bacterium]|nr:TPM domain-containing protein [Eubacteriales bacterium]
MRVLMRALLCALLICCVLLPVQAEGSYPACQGIVSDWAGVIGGQTAQDLDTLSTRLSDQTGGRLYVAVRHFLGGAEARAYADGLFTAWNLGEQDALLLLVIGEETYALHLGDQARRLIPAEGQTALLAAQLRAPFQARDYDGALAAFAPAYAQALAKAAGKSVNVSGLFGTEEVKAVQPTAQPSASAIWQSMFGQDVSDGSDWQETQQREEKRTNWRTIVIWGLVIYFLFFRRKRHHRTNFGHGPRRRW